MTFNFMPSISAQFTSLTVPLEVTWVYIIDMLNTKAEQQAYLKKIGLCFAEGDLEEIIQEFLSAHPKRWL